MLAKLCKQFHIIHCIHSFTKMKNLSNYTKFYLNPKKKFSIREKNYPGCEFHYQSHKIDKFLSYKYSQPLSMLTFRNIQIDIIKYNQHFSWQQNIDHKQLEVCSLYNLGPFLRRKFWLFKLCMKSSKLPVGSLSCVAILYICSILNKEFPSRDEMSFNSLMNLKCEKGNVINDEHRYNVPQVRNEPEKGNVFNETHKMFHV